MVKFACRIVWFIDIVSLDINVSTKFEIRTAVLKDIMIHAHKHFTGKKKHIKWGKMFKNGIQCEFMNFSGYLLTIIGMNQFPSAWVNGCDSIDR